MDEIQIFTDGACSGNPGPGGWAYIMRWKNHEKKNSGCSKHTTNNIMELSAVVEAFETILRPVSRIAIYSDSQYVVRGINEWLESWKKRNFTNIKNPELWHKLDELINKKADIVDAIWVRGHNGHLENEEVDKMAVEAINSCR